MPLAQAIDSRFGAAGVPAVYGLSFGHVRDQLTLPVGVRARLDAGAQTLTLLEPAVA
jgi:muramoyltetrapeptide carboxypeptidase